MTGENFWEPESGVSRSSSEIAGTDASGSSNKREQTIQPRTSSAKDKKRKNFTTISNGLSSIRIWFTLRDKFPYDENISNTPRLVHKAYME